MWGINLPDSEPWIIRFGGYTWNLERDVVGAYLLRVGLYWFAKVQSPGNQPQVIGL
jgi:hypothetical protein